MYVECKYEFCLRWITVEIITFLDKINAIVLCLKIVELI